MPRSIDHHPASPRVDQGSRPPLGSDWTGLSSHLIASFFPVRRVVESTTLRWERELGAVEVRAPITDGSLEQSANWTSPFEAQTPDARLSSFSSMLQVGGFDAILNSLQQYLPADTFLGGAVDVASQQLTTLEGRTGVTKLNSTQVFSGMPPLKITVTAHFRALFDPVAEVQAPMSQLMAWTLPRKLAQQGIVGNVLDASKKEGVLRTAFPSETPQVIGMQYADMLFKPLVIESVPHSLTGPRDRNGHLISGAMTLSLATLTAIDKDDWAKFRRF